MVSWGVENNERMTHIKFIKICHDTLNKDCKNLNDFGYELCINNEINDGIYQLSIIKVIITL